MQGRIHKQKYKSLVSAQSLWFSNTAHPLVLCLARSLALPDAELSAEGQGGLSRGGDSPETVPSISLVSSCLLPMNPLTQASKYYLPFTTWPREGKGFIQSLH